MTRALTLSLIALLVLAGCATTPPLVDLTRVDMGAYSRDQIACDQEHRQTSFYAGDFTADCMARRGYKVAKTGR